MRSSTSTSIRTITCVAAVLLGCSCLFASSGGRGALRDDVLRFAIMPDTHISIGGSSQKALSLAIADMNSLSDSLDFVLVPGDLTEFGSDEEIRYIKKALDSLVIPYYVLPGNHDAKWSESGCNTFAKVFGYERFEFRCKGWRFLGCKSGPDMRMAPGLVPTEDVEFIKSREYDDKTVFVNHYPIDTTLLNGHEVARAARNIGAKIFLGGHFHEFLEIEHDGPEVGVPNVLVRSLIMSPSSMDMNPGYRFPIGYTIATISDYPGLGRAGFAYSERGGGWDGLFRTKREGLGMLLEKLPMDTAEGFPDYWEWMTYEVNERFPQVCEDWHVEEHENIAAGFAVDGDCAYYPLQSGVVKCISLKDGKCLWSRKLDGKVFSTPAVCDGILVVGCADGYVYGLNARNGKLRWVVAADKSVLASPVIMDGIAYVGASDGCFRAIRVKDGTVLWRFRNVKGFVEDKAYVDEEQVVFGSWGNMLYSLDPRTGKLQWATKVGGGNRMLSPAACTPVKAAGRIYVAVPDRKIHVFDAKTGEELRTLSGSRENLLLDGDKLYCKNMASRAQAFAVNASGEERLWEVKTELGYDISPTNISKIGETLVLPTDKGNLVGISAEEGKHLWSHKISLALVNPISVLEDGSLLVSTMDGHVVRLRF